jgi:hypothetical protein
MYLRIESPFFYTLLGTRLPICYIACQVRLDYTFSFGVGNPRL